MTIDSSNVTSNLLSKIQCHYQSEYNNVPSSEYLFSWINHLYALLFPKQNLDYNEIEDQFSQNKLQFEEILLQIEENELKVNDLRDAFYAQLDIIYDKLHEDAKEFLANDPAATCLNEIIHTYPGFYAIFIYRIANCLSSTCNIAFIPRMLSEYAHSKTGIDIHPNAKIDFPFFIDHGTGVVIGETCVIGKHVNLYQGVTLGAIQVSKELQGKKRHPTIEDNVIIYANATILGGNTVVGNNSVIGGNVFLTKSIDPYSLVFNQAKTIVKEIKTIKEPINFII